MYKCSCHEFMGNDFWFLPRNACLNKDHHCDVAVFDDSCNAPSAHDVERAEQERWDALNLARQGRATVDRPTTGVGSFCKRYRADGPTPCYYPDCECTRPVTRRRWWWWWWLPRFLGTGF